NETVDEAYALALFHNSRNPLMIKRYPHNNPDLEDAYAAPSDERRLVDTEKPRLTRYQAPERT
ncbi:histidine kinase, partial [Pseudomonas aeruginosa]